jgi:hypothetical protein
MNELQWVKRIVVASTAQLKSVASEKTASRVRDNEAKAVRRL